jgi:hypothetical protein
MMDTGIQKTVTEPYLIDALSFTEAEARAIEELKPYISGEFGIAGITRKKFSESFFNETGDRYYNARLHFITLDEKSGSEKKTNVNMLVQASELKEALEVVESEMKKTMIDYTFAGISETAIMDVFPYDASTTLSNRKTDNNDN